MPHLKKCSQNCVLFTIFWCCVKSELLRNQPIIKTVRQKGWGGREGLAGGRLWWVTVRQHVVLPTTRINLRLIYCGSPG